MQYAVLMAAGNGMQPEAVEGLQQLVLDTHVGAVRRDSIEDPPADFELMRVNRVPGVTVVQSRPYLHAKVVRLEERLKNERRARAAV